MNRITANRRRRGHAATAVVVTPDGDIAALVRRHAPEHVTPRALELEALLHLPRLAGVDGTVPTDRADTEIERLARRLVEFYEPALDLAQPPPVKPDIATLEVDAVEEQLARRVTLRFHYLHYPRRDSLHRRRKPRQLHRDEPGRAVLLHATELDCTELASLSSPQGTASKRRSKLAGFLRSWALSQNKSKLEFWNALH